MASNGASAIAASKATNTPKGQSASGQLSPAQSQTGSISTGDSYGQRRGGGSGSFGAGATSRASPAPRNNQASRKQHRGAKRYKGAVDEDAMAESTAMRSNANRRGQNITHLMHYSMSPSPYLTHRNYGSHLRYTRRPPTWGIGSGYHAADKARYVHSNYRFIVDPRANYHPQVVDADVHTDWSNVLQILVSSQSQSASCPICLGDPVAPRMAKCGHIFCLPCLIRYMHSEDETQHIPEKRARSKKCPLCWDSIYVSETRPVRFYTGQEGEPLREGMDVVLRLVMRPSGSTLALPRDGATVLEKGEDIPWFFAAEVMDYARIMKGTEDYMQEQYDADIKALELQGKEDELMFGEDNVEWTQRAVRIIKEAKEKVKDIGGPASTSPKPAKPKPKRAPIEFTNNSDVPEMYTMQHAANSGHSLSSGSAAGSTPLAESSPQAKPTSATPTSTSISEASQAASTAIHKQPAPHFHPRGSHAPSEYYFYQALLHYYLSPLDIRILREAFGPFSSFPATILPKVERVVPRVVDDDVRKRTKYLSHLPYGCEVNFLECDWTDTVPTEVLEKFKVEIETRRRRNEEKEAREEKARLQAEKEEDEKRYAHLRRRRPEPEIEPSSNAFSQDDFQPLVAAEVAETAEAADADADAHSTSPPWPTRRQGSAFASLATISTSPNATRTVWGTPAIPPSSPPLIAAPPEPPEDDGWLQDWEKDLLQEEDVIAQAQAMSLNGESSKAGTPSSSGKKKKAKKITLMSTNVRRGA